MSVQGVAWFRMETHSHSRVSDGRASPEDLVRAARRRGVKLLAVTDHNTFDGSRLASRASVVGDVRVVYGNEVRTTWGDVNVLCPSDPQGEPPRDPLELREWASERGCILVAVHPFNIFWRSVGRMMARKDVFDAAEVWNAYTLPIFNLAAIAYSNRTGVIGVSGSDAHVASMVGVAPTLVAAETPEAALEAIRRGECKPVLGLPGPRGVGESIIWSLERRLARLRSLLQPR